MTVGSTRVVMVIALCVGACSAPRPLPLGKVVAERSPVAQRDALPAVYVPDDVAGPRPTRQRATAPQEPRVWYGAELRAYPAGLIGVAISERPVNEHEVVLLMAGANHTDRDDFGERDDEEGSGYGAGVGYRHYYGERLNGWFVGARLELWMLTIDWTDNPGKPNKKKGTTDVWVLQPTADLGYGFLLDERSRLNVFVSGGAEINVHTSGKSVGEGPIGLVGVSWVYGF